VGWAASVYVHFRVFKSSSFLLLKTKKKFLFFGLILTDFIQSFETKKLNSNITTLNFKIFRISCNLVWREYFRYNYIKMVCVLARRALCIVCNLCVVLFSLYTHNIAECLAPFFLALYYSTSQHITLNSTVHE